MAQYSIDIAEQQAALAINRMYRHLAEEIANTRDVDTAIENFGMSEKRRLYLSFMQAYAAGIVAANKDIQRNAPRRVAADWGVQETFPLEDDPFVAQYATEAIYDLKGIPENDRSEIRWRLTHAISSGASIPSITDDLLKYFDGDRIRANRFARTATSDILNRATLHRYEDSGVVDGIKFMAHIDARTSETCRVMNGTIWALNDPSIQTPPLHFNCRSRIVGYFGKIPGARDYSTDFDQDTIDRAFGDTDTFRNRYWGRFPRTRSSAVLQRHYLNTVDIDIIREGLTKLIQSPTVGTWNTDLAKRLKAILRYRAVERDSSIVVDAFGKSLLLDVTEREAIRAGLAQLIRLQRLRIDRAVAELPIWSDLARPGRERLIAEMRLTLALYERCLAELPF